MPFQLIWEYEEVFEIDDSESHQYYLSKTLPWSMIEKKHAWKNSVIKKIVNLAVCYKLVMIIMQSVCICLSVCMYICVSVIL